MPLALSLGPFPSLAGLLGAGCFSLLGAMDTCPGGRTRGWEAGLFRGHLEEGLHDYTVGEPRAGSRSRIFPPSLPRWCWRRV